MAFRRRFSRRRFGRRAVKRKEPIWLTTAFEAVKPNGPVNRDFFELVSPADYTPDWVDGGIRSEGATLIRTVGAFQVLPFLSFGTVGPNATNTQFKAVLFTASERSIDDGFANDPGQFDIAFDPSKYAQFARDFRVLHTFWLRRFTYAVSTSDLATAGAGDVWIPPDVPSSHMWDVTVRAKLSKDEAVWLLINKAFIAGGEITNGGSLEVEARCLIHD